MTTPKKKHRLRHIELTELSLVDRPANPHARVTLFKRAKDDKEREMRLQTRDEPLAFRSFEEACAHLHKLRGGGRADAMTEARRRYPDLLRKFNDDAAGEAAARAERLDKSRSRPEAVVKAVNDFDLLVDAIAERDGVSRSAAMSRARREHPREFRAYQEA